jgi:hypothetical protein
MQGALAPCFPVPKIEHTETRGGWSRQVLAGNATAAPLVTPVELFPATALPLSKLRSHIYGGGSLGASRRKRRMCVPSPGGPPSCMRAGADGAGELGPGGCAGSWGGTPGGADVGAGAPAVGRRIGSYSRDFVRRQYEMAERRRREVPGTGVDGDVVLQHGGVGCAAVAAGGGELARSGYIIGRREPSGESGSPRGAPVPAQDGAEVYMMFPHSRWLAAPAAHEGWGWVGAARNDGLEGVGGDAARRGGVLQNSAPRSMEGLSQAHHWRQAAHDLTLGAPKRKRRQQDDGLAFPGAGGHGVGACSVDLVWGACDDSACLGRNVNVGEESTVVGVCEVGGREYEVVCEWVITVV